MVRCGLSSISVAKKGSTTVSWSGAKTNGLAITAGAKGTFLGIGLSASRTVSTSSTITNGKVQSDEHTTNVTYADCAFKGPLID